MRQNPQYQNIPVDQLARMVYDQDAELQDISFEQFMPIFNDTGEVAQAAPAAQQMNPAPAEEMGYGQIGLDSIDAAQSGFLNASAGLAEGVGGIYKWATGEESETAGDIAGYLRDAGEDQIQQMSESGRNQMQNFGVEYSSEDGPSMREGSTLVGGLLNIASGVGSSIPYLVPGGLGAKVLSQSGRAVGGTIIPSLARKQAMNLPAGRIPQSLSMAAVGGTGLGGETKNQAYQKAYNSPAEELNKTPAYQAAYWEIADTYKAQGTKVSHAQIEEMARTAVAEAAGDDAFKDGFQLGAVSMGALGPMFLNNVLGRVKGGFIKRAASGASIEGTQELVESGGQAYLSNLAVNENANSSIQPMDNVVSEGLTGALIGAGTGGSMSLAGGFGSKAVGITKEKDMPGYFREQERLRKEGIVAEKEQAAMDAESVEPAVEEGVELVEDTETPTGAAETPTETLGEALADAEEQAALPAEESADSPDRPESSEVDPVEETTVEESPEKANYRADLQIALDIALAQSKNRKLTPEARQAASDRIAGIQDEINKLDETLASTELDLEIETPTPVTPASNPALTKRILEWSKVQPDKASDRYDEQRVYKDAIIRELKSLMKMEVGSDQAFRKEESIRMMEEKFDALAPTPLNEVPRWQQALEEEDAVTEAQLQEYGQMEAGTVDSSTEVQDDVTGDNLYGVFANQETNPFASIDLFGRLQPIKEDGIAIDLKGVVRDNMNSLRANGTPDNKNLDRKTVNNILTKDAERIEALTKTSAINMVVRSQYKKINKELGKASADYYIESLGRGMGLFSNPTPTKLAMYDEYVEGLNDNVVPLTYEVWESTILQKGKAPSLTAKKPSPQPVEEPVEASESVSAEVAPIQKTADDFQDDGTYYRVVVGDTSFQDIVDSGEVRTNASSKKPRKADGKIDLSSRPTKWPSFSKDSASMDYAGKNEDHYIVVTNDPSIQPSKQGRHGKGTTQFPTDANGNPMESLSGDAISVYKHTGNGNYELVYNRGQVVSKPDSDPTPTKKAIPASQVKTEAKGTTVADKKSSGNQAVLEENEESVIDELPVDVPVLGKQVVEVLISDLTLSEDVPQFKDGADSEGVVDPLGGTFDRTGVAPIQIWLREDGRKEVISGRHRLDLAKRSGETTIPAQYHLESEGFGAAEASILDALLNIREGQGKVKDYVGFIQARNLTEEEADAEGILARPTGKRAYTIASQGSPALVAAHRADQIGDNAASLISQAAPNNEPLQAVGLKALQEGKSITVSVNIVKAVNSMTRDTAQESGDLFGFDDSAMKEAENLARKAGQKQAEIQRTLTAVTGAAKNPELAAAEGVDVQDPEAVQARVAELKDQKREWQNWHTNPALVAELTGNEVAAPVVEVTADEVSAPAVEATDSEVTEPIVAEATDDEVAAPALELSNQTEEELATKAGRDLDAGETKEQVDREVDGFSLDGGVSLTTQADPAQNPQSNDLFEGNPDVNEVEVEVESTPSTDEVVNPSVADPVADTTEVVAEENTDVENDVLNDVVPADRGAVPEGEQESITLYGLEADGSTSNNDPTDLINDVRVLQFVTRDDGLKLALYVGDKDTSDTDAVVYKSMDKAEAASKDLESKGLGLYRPTMYKKRFALNALIVAKNQSTDVPMVYSNKDSSDQAKNRMKSKEAYDIQESGAGKFYIVTTRDSMDKEGKKDNEASNYDSITEVRNNLQEDIEENVPSYVLSQTTNEKFPNQPQLFMLEGKTDNLLKYVQGNQIDDLSNVAEELLDVKSKEKSKTLIAAVEFATGRIDTINASLKKKEQQNKIVLEDGKSELKAVSIMFRSVNKFESKVNEDGSLTLFGNNKDLERFLSKNKLTEGQQPVYGTLNEGEFSVSEEQSGTVIGIKVPKTTATKLKGKLENKALYFVDGEVEGAAYVVNPSKPLLQKKDLTVNLEEGRVVIPEKEGRSEDEIQEDIEIGRANAMESKASDPVVDRQSYESVRDELAGMRDAETQEISNFLDGTATSDVGGASTKNATEFFDSIGDGDYGFVSQDEVTNSAEKSAQKDSDEKVEADPADADLIEELLGDLREATGIIDDPKTTAADRKTTEGLARKIEEDLVALNAGDQFIKISAKGSVTEAKNQPVEKPKKKKVANPKKKTTEDNSESPFDMFNTLLNDYPPLYVSRRQLKGMTGMSVEDVQAVIDKFEAKYNGIPDIKYMVADIPLDGGQASLSGMAGGVPTGSFDAKNKLVTLNSAGLNNVAEVESVLRHEILAHYGLSVFPTLEERMDILTKVSKAEGQNEELTKIFKEVRKSYSARTDAWKERGATDESIEAMVAEEVFARVAEERDQSVFGEAWDAIVSYVMKALRKVGFYDHYTKSDVRRTLQSFGKQFTQADVETSLQVNAQVQEVKFSIPPEDGVAGVNSSLDKLLAKVNARKEKDDKAKEAKSAKIGAQQIFDQRASLETEAKPSARPTERLEKDLNLAEGRAPAVEVMPDLIPDRAKVSDHSSVYSDSLDAGQRMGVDLAMTTMMEKGSRGFLLADGTGFGKTRQILAMADQFKKATGQKVLILTENEPTLKKNFADDAASMGIDMKQFKTGTYNSFKDGGQRNGIKPEFDQEWGMVIFDEAHNLKNYNTLQAKAARRLSKSKVVYATATPMDRPSAGAYMWADVMGQSYKEALDNLGMKLVNGPKVKVDGKYVEGNKVVELKKGISPKMAIERVAIMRNSAIKSGRMIKRYYPFFGTTSEIKVEMEQQSRLDQDDIDNYWQGEINSGSGSPKNLRGQRILELVKWEEHLKIDAVMDKLKEDLSKGMQVVVAAETVSEDLIVKGLEGGRVSGFISLIEGRLDAENIDYVSIKGKTTPAQRAKSVEEFQSGNIPLMVMTTQAGGTGINLDDTVGDKPRSLIMVTKNWSGSKVMQLIGRVSRKTTQSPSVVNVVSLEGGLADAHKSAVVSRKLKTLLSSSGEPSILEDLDATEWNDVRDSNKNYVGSKDGSLIDDVDSSESEATSSIPPADAQPEVDSSMGDNFMAVLRKHGTRPTPDETASGKKFINLKSSVANKETIQATLARILPKQKNGDDSKFSKPMKVKGTKNEWFFYVWNTDQAKQIAADLEKRGVNYSRQSVNEVARGLSGKSVKDIEGWVGKSILDKMNSLGHKVEVVQSVADIPPMPLAYDPMVKMTVIDQVNAVFDEVREVKDLVSGKDAVEVAEAVAASAPNALHRDIAAKVAVQLRQLRDLGSDVGFQVLQVGDSAPSNVKSTIQSGAKGLTVSADPRLVAAGNLSGKVYIVGDTVSSSKNGLDFETITHELVHLSTAASHVAGRVPANKDTPYAKLFDDMESLMKVVSAHGKRQKNNIENLPKFQQDLLNGYNNSAESGREIMAWGLTNGDFQTYLESIPLNDNKTAWDSFVQSVREFLGINPNDGTALSEMLRISNETLSLDLNQVSELLNSNISPDDVSVNKPMAIDPNAKGMFIPSRGISYLVADNLHSKAETRSTFSHEVVGHYGMQQMMGNEFGSLLDTVQDMKAKGDPEVVAAAKVVETRSGNLGREEEAEEIIAVLAEDLASRSFMTKVYDAIRMWIKRTFSSNYVVSNSNLRDLLLDAQRHVSKDVSNESVAPQTASEILYSKVSKMDLPKQLEVYTDALENVHESLGGLAKQDFINSTKDGASAILNQNKTRNFLQYWLTNTQIHRTYKSAFDWKGGNPLKRINDLLGEFRVDKERALHGFEKEEKIWDKLSAKESNSLASLMRDSTIAGIHPNVSVENKVHDYVREDKKKLDRKKLKDKPTTTDLDDIVRLEESIKFMKEEHARLSREWNKLSVNAKTVYEDTRIMLKSQFEQEREELLNRIDRQIESPVHRESAKKALETRMGDLITRGPYFPLSRFGDHVVIAFADINGKREFVREQFESRSEAERALKWHKSKWGENNARMTYMADMSKTSKSDDLFAFRDNLFTALDDNRDETLSDDRMDDDAKAAIRKSTELLKNEINDLMLNTLPSSSIMQRRRHRHGTKGASSDMRRSVQNVMLQSAQQISKIKYADRIRSELNDIGIENRKFATGDQSEVKQQYADVVSATHAEMSKRFELTMNPTGAAWASNAGRLAFFQYLGWSPAAAIVNLTQVPAISIPVIGARYGMAKTTGVFLKVMTDWHMGKSELSTREAYKSFARDGNKNVTKDEQNFIKVLIDRGDIDITRVGSITEEAHSDQRTPSVFGTKMQKLMRTGAYMFHGAEMSNREVTGLATYRLIKDKHPELFVGSTFNSSESMSENELKVYEEVRELIGTTQFLYESENRPRAMRENNIIRTMTTFKIYGQHIIYMYAQLGREALGRDKSLSPEKRREAQKALAGLVAFQMLAAGATGVLPIAVAISMMSAAYNMFADDEEEIVSPEASFTQWIDDMVKGAFDDDEAKFMSALLSKGIGNALGVDVSSRVSQDTNLLLMMPDRPMSSGKELYKEALLSLAGPVFGGIGVNVANFAQDVYEGNPTENLKSVLPKALRDIYKSVDYSQNGVKTRNDLDVIESLDTSDIVIQAMGFTPEVVSSTYTRAFARLNKSQHIAGVRRDILGDVYTALSDGDKGSVEESLAQVTKWNEFVMEKLKSIKSPAMKALFLKELITSKTISSSLKTKMIRKLTATEGVVLPKKHMYLIDDYTFGT